MSDFEIARSFRNAKRKKSQLLILSQLNAVPPDRIVQIVKNYEKNAAKLRENIDGYS